MRYRVAKNKSGSSDPKSAWSRARHLWTGQMQVRLGVKTAEEVTSEYFELPKGVEVIVPAYFSVAESHPLDQHRTIFWDETHKKQRLGDEPGALRYMFPRDEEGRYDPEGEVGERKVSTT